MNDKKISLDHDSNITIIGVGKAGNKIIENMSKKINSNATFLYVNNKAHLLESFDKTNCIYLNDDNQGLTSTSDFATDSDNLNTGKNYLEQIKNKLETTKLLIIIAGMGGSTGTQTSNEIAKVAKEMSILTISMVTTPFSFESKHKIEKAKAGIKLLEQNSDATIIISNDKLLNNYPSIPITDAYQLTNNVLKNSVKALMDLMSRSAMLNVDFEDFKSTLKNKGEAYIGFGKGVGRYKIDKAISAAINSKIIDKKINNCKNVIINIVTDPQTSLTEANEITNKIKELISPDLEIIFGFDVNPKLRNEVQLSIIATFDKELQEETQITNLQLDNKKTQELLLEIGNTLELELNGEQNLDQKSNQTFLDDKLQEDKVQDDIFMENENEDDDIPFFLK